MHRPRHQGSDKLRQACLSLAWTGQHDLCSGNGVSVTCGHAGHLAGQLGSMCGPRCCSCSEPFQRVLYGTLQSKQK